jgi:hypothetical protein
MTEKTPGPKFHITDEQMALVFEWAHRFYETHLKYKLIKDANERTDSGNAVRYFHPDVPEGSRSVQAQRPKSISPKRLDLQEIRDWAKSNGHDVSDRGRIPAGVVAAYDAR